MDGKPHRDYTTWGKPRGVRRPNQPYDYPGLCAHIVFCINGRTAHFMPPERAANACNLIRDIIDPSRFEVWGICVMPDHVHMLAEVKADGQHLSKLVSFVKQQLTRRITPTPEWQKNYWDHILRPHEDPMNHARYIVENPVEAGLVRYWDEWPGSFLSKHIL